MSAALPEPSIITAAMPSLRRSLMIRIASIPPSSNKVTIGIPKP